MDARIYPGSVFEWQVLDASTSSPVPGFERLTSTWADLGMIDAQAHPLLRFKVHMKEAPDGETSEIRSWSLNGHLHKSFDSDPTDEGWTLQGGSWSNGAITSSTSVLSDTYHVRSGFSAIDTNSTHTGAGMLQYSLDGGSVLAEHRRRGQRTIAATSVHGSIPNGECHGRWDVHMERFPSRVDSNLHPGRCPTRCWTRRSKRMVARRCRSRGLRASKHLDHG